MSPTRDRIAATLMIILGIATIGAFANSALEFSSVAPDRVHVEAWRMLAFVVFAGLFTLLGIFPRRMPGLWELLFFQKGGVPIFLTYIVNANTVANASLTDAAMIAVDAGLAATTLLCYVLTEGWRAWAPGQPQPSRQ
ncbi:MAG: hypothetical protein ABL932_18055 [Terricaulis sp.]